MRPGYVLVLVFAGSAALAVGLVALSRSSPTAAGRPSSPAPPASAPDLEPASLAETAHAVASAAPSAIDATNAPPVGLTTDCPADMLLVDGWYCPFVAHRCDKARKPSRPGAPEVCDAFRPEVLCEGTLERTRFCVDPYEYPNRAGMLPAVLVDFDEAARACEIEGKRLCTAREWTLACEGETIYPYPTGVRRDRSLCRWDAGPEGRVAPSAGPGVEAALARIDRRAPAGSHASCASPFGALDMAANVAEWAVDPHGSRKREPFVSVIAGGAWGDGPATCRTADPSLPPAHRAATLGFRCCSDAAPPPGAGSEATPARKKAPGGGFRPLPTPSP
jgi:hypothetical protein